MNYCHCDRCGIRCEYWGDRAPEYFNCGPCEQDYQINLWLDHFMSENYYDDDAGRLWDDLFFEEHGQTYSDYCKKYEKYIMGDITEDELL